MKPLSDYKYVSYLIGSMEHTAEGDSGESKRKVFVDGLLKRNIYPIDPTESEAKRTGYCPKVMKEKMAGWIASGHWKLYGEYSEYIWRGRHFIDDAGNLIYIPGDFHYVKISDFITAIINRNDKPVGTFGEAGMAAELKIPIYVITDMTIHELPGSLLQWVTLTGGQIFKSKHDYFHYIDTYKLGD